MERRSFVRLAAAGAVAAWLRDGAARAEANTASVRPRNLLPPVAGGAIAPGLIAVDAAATAAWQASVFPQSVASGDPAPDGIVLWTRVQAPRGGIVASRAGWQIAADAAFADVRVEGLAVVDPARDFTLRFFVESSALAPATTYHYRFVADGVASRTGRFRTLPAPGASLASLRLGVAVCQEYNQGYYVAWRHLATEALDAVVFLGDYIYEYAGATDRPFVRDRGPLPSGGATPQSLADYRQIYKVTRSDPDLQAAHENFAWIQLWDDHEFYNDCHGDQHPDNLPAGDTAATPFPMLRQAANQAWAEYSPSRVGFDATADWQASVQLYRSFVFGDLAKLVATDERLYRDGPPCGDAEAERYATLGCANRTAQGRSMLGTTQASWFLDEITGSTARWKLWANEVMLMQLKVGPIFFDLDQWDGYAAERAALLGAIGRAGVKNFVALTGDLHTFLAGDIKTDFDSLFSASVGVELMVGSISSSNFADQIAAATYASGSTPARIMGVPYDVLQPLIRLNNPHLRYFNSATHGYMVVAMTRDALTCTFKAVRSVTDPDAGLIDPLAVFEVADGKPTVRLVKETVLVL